MSSALTITLYGTTACHLCEAAAALLQPFAGNGVRVNEVDITDDPALMERYQLRIPVLKREDTGDELDWPVSFEQLILWLSDVIGEEA